MTWAKVDDGWWCHPKVMGLSLAARGLWVSALSWSDAQRVDVVPARFLPLVGASWPDALELVGAGMWVQNDDGDTFTIVPWESICPPKRRPSIPRSLRYAVYERDGWACVVCGVSADLTLDHVIPWSRGGPDTYDNLQTMCRPCNSRKGDAMPGEDR